MIVNPKGKFIYKYRWLILVCLIQMLIALFYSGSNFLIHIFDTIHSSPVGGSVQFMTPGDQFEQFTRYNLVKYNIERGHWLYYLGYIYNFDNITFSEGMTFFPFSFIGSLLAFLSSNIFSYNLMAIISYLLIGITMYLLAYNITNNHIGSLIASVFISAVPFRTSFLYGEMVYGLDMSLLPLPILFTELGLKRRKKRYFFLFGLSVLFLVTSNFQMTYFFAIFTFPYFLYRGYQLIKSKEIKLNQKMGYFSLAFIGIIISIIYIILIAKFLHNSGLQNGQNLSEVLFYSPSFKNIFSVYNGNEKNVYLGFSFIFVIIWLIFLPWQKDYNKKELEFVKFFAPMFLISYILCFGPNIDRITNTKIYLWIYNNIPYWNSTRTTGRIMSVASFYYAILLSIVISTIAKKLSFFKQKVGLIIFVLLIVFDFHYTNPSMIYLDTNNKIYKYLQEVQPSQFGNSNIVAVPFQREADHYFNATYNFYATNYNIRMFNGHSSMYPMQYKKLPADLQELNSGNISDLTLNWLRFNQVNYIVVHRTDFEPSVSGIILAKFINNPGLELIKDDSNIYLFKINWEKVKPNNAEKMDYLTLFNTLNSIPGKAKEYGSIQFIDGWYSREIYPNQRPYRWMNGTYSSLAYVQDKKINSPRILKFSYKAGVQSNFVLKINGQEVYNSKVVPSDWTDLEIDLSKFTNSNLYIEFFVDKEFKVPSDNRNFGLMVSDLEIK